MIGGGTDPTTDEAVGAAAIGVELNNGDITAGAGNISIRGRGEAAGADNYGVSIRNGSVLQTTSGNVAVTGIGGNGTSGNQGIRFTDAGTEITTADGDITLHGNRRRGLHTILNGIAARPPARARQPAPAQGRAPSP